MHYKINNYNQLVKQSDRLEAWMVLIYFADIFSIFLQESEQESEII